MKIYTPTGRLAPARTTSTTSLGTLAGKRIGILENRKPNSRLLMTHLAERLCERTGAELVAIESKNAAIAASDQLLGQLTKEVELVLTGSAD